MSKKIRRKYLDKITEAIGTEDIKVITGVRRSGKSVLLVEFKKYIEKNIPNANIIFIDYSLVKNEPLQEYHALNDYVENAYIEGKVNFVLIDEVQMCQGFEKTINSLHATHQYDIYVTGSNAFLSSSDLATLFVGRTYTIEVFPFSFKEFIEYFGYTDKFEAFQKYIQEGGIAGSYKYPSLEAKLSDIREVYDALIIRDIKNKYNVQGEVVLDAISDFLMDNISRTTSIRNIANVLNSEHLDTSDKTVGTYLKYLCEAYAFYKVQRYDIRGKRYLASQDKYYLSDHSFRTAKLGEKWKDTGSIYENIVAIELKRRGYEVYVGEMRDSEIDFVAIKNGNKLYIQVSSIITEQSTMEREVKPLINIPGGYSKLLIAETHQPKQNYEGIQIIDIADWLLEDEN
ncbi:ATP-binding protein [Candidatus Saccharibacteria bacterium]|nr:ATP-binding protein [Candidatus Saccharibacteria bacterium]